MALYSYGPLGRDEAILYRYGLYIVMALYSYGPLGRDEAILYRQKAVLIPGPRWPPLPCASTTTPTILALVSSQTQPHSHTDADACLRTGSYARQSTCQYRRKIAAATT